LKRTFIWGHRGVGIYEIENTLTSFKKAVEMGVDGIETDAHLTLDGEIILYHDFLIEHNRKKIEINKSYLDEIKKIELEKNERVPTLREVFEEFQDKDIKYSIDLRGANVGLKIIDLADQFKILNKVELVCDGFFRMSKLRKANKEATIIYSISERHTSLVERDFKFKKMKKLNITGFNIKHSQASLKFFNLIKRNGLAFYVWGVTTRKSMERFLSMNYNDEIVDAIYTDYPDKLIELRKEIQGV
jgi:glycerophosphoryl diester phosphodiesterase